MPGWKLANAVQAMQNWMETEEKERDFFYVDDKIFCPRSFSRRLAVRVNYRWRLNAENGWSFGSIAFIHDFELLPDDAAPIAKRKLSATKKEQELQETRYRAWDDLRWRALCSVWDHFKSHGYGTAIPETFHPKPDSHSSWLNNFSTEFWRASV